MSSDDPQHGDLPAKLLAAMQARSGKHPGHRTGHAKGILLEGTFTPSTAAHTLSHAPHFTQPSTPLLARFSAGGGNPHVPDASDAAMPKGLALRFLLNKAGTAHTDIIMHSYPGFHSRTGEDFHAFLTLGRLAGTGDAAHKANFESYLAAHPAARAFVETHKRKPVSYGSLAYYGVNAHVLRNGEGKATSMRYRLDPAQGEQLLDSEQVGSAGENYLSEELRARLPGRPVVFELQAHVAGNDDVVDDATVPFNTAEFVPLGSVSIERIVEDNAARQKEIAFSAVPGDVEGVEASNDPLLQMLVEAYRVSVAQRGSEQQANPSRL